MIQVKKNGETSANKITVLKYLHIKPRVPFTQEEAPTHFPNIWGDKYR
jgi:hypothetical protein